MSTYDLDFRAGPISGDEAAPEIAEHVARARQGKWNGQWTTVVPGHMSVVGIELNTQNDGKNEITADLLAGPLYSNDEAQKFGPAIAASYGGEFTGKWTTIQGSVPMSVINVRFKY